MNIYFSISGKYTITAAELMIYYFQLFVPLDSAYSKSLQETAPFSFKKSISYTEPMQKSC